MPSRSKTGAVPFGVALGEVVVDGDEVDALVGERVQVERQARDERLSFTGLHLGDVALVQDDPAHHLDVEDALVGLAQARFAHGGERLEEDVLELLAVREPLAELDRLPAQLVVGELLEVGLQRRDVGACSARRFMRRPSPKRRAFSKDPQGRHSGQGTRRYSAVASTSQRSPASRRRPDDVVASLPLSRRLECRRGVERRPAVDVERPSLSRHDELELAARLACGLEDDDRRGPDGPGGALLSPGLGAERWVERRSNGVGERPDGLVGRSALGEQCVRRRAPRTRPCLPRARAPSR